MKCIKIIHFWFLNLCICVILIFKKKKCMIHHTFHTHREFSGKCQPWANYFRLKNCNIHIFGFEARARGLMLGHHKSFLFLAIAGDSRRRWVPRWLSLLARCLFGDAMRSEATRRRCCAFARVVWTRCGGGSCDVLVVFEPRSGALLETFAHTLWH